MTRPISNSEIAELLARHAELLTIAGESTFRARAFTRAAEAIRVYPEAMTTVAARGELRTIPGVGEGIAAAIEQILASGSFDAHHALLAEFPESLIALTAIPGIGTKTAQRLYRELGVDSLSALEAAVMDGRVARAKGLGRRVEDTIRAGIAALERRSGRIPLGVALPIARAFVETYRAARPGDEIDLAGSARRWEITVGDLDVVIGSADPASVAEVFERLPLVAAVEMRSEAHARLKLGDGLECDVYICSPDSFGATLVRATGNAAHVARLGAIPDRAATEAEVYAKHGLPWIPPELRQGNVEFSRSAEIDALVTLDAINGEFHAHSRWSDGSGTIQEMAEAAAARGYAFLGITDHSHGLGVAGGLTEQRLAEQRRELESLQPGSEIRLLAGAEVEVRSDGTLDYPDDVLARLDVVVASLHTGLRRSRDQLTDRLVRVLENPHVDIIAHPSGRLIERREGGDFDWERVFTIAAKTGTALEINADPARLDLDPHLAMQAAAAGCLITVNCDAHRPDGFATMEYGVAMARRAWLTPPQILNCWSREHVLDWLASRRRSG